MIWIAGGLLTIAIMFGANYYGITDLRATQTSDRATANTERIVALETKVNIMISNQRSIDDKLDVIGFKMDQIIRNSGVSSR